MMENPFEIIIEKLNSLEKMVLEIKAELRLENPKVAFRELMDINQLSDYSFLSKASIYTLTMKREIPHFKQGKRLLFKKSEIDDWILKSRKKTREELYAEATLKMYKKRLK
jgi:excisionase family DNA binding protein